MSRVIPEALPFDLATAPIEFTVVAKEVKLIALLKDVRINQYLLPRRLVGQNQILPNLSWSLPESKLLITYLELKSGRI